MTEAEGPGRTHKDIERLEKVDDDHEETTCNCKQQYLVPNHDHN